MTGDATIHNTAQLGSNRVASGRICAKFIGRTLRKPPQDVAEKPQNVAEKPPYKQRAAQNQAARGVGELRSCASFFVSFAFRATPSSAPESGSLELSAPLSRHAGGRA